MKYAITVEEVLQIIRNKRNMNEAWMFESLKRDDVSGHSGHTQRRDACNELLSDIWDINRYKEINPAYTVPELTLEDAAEKASVIADRREVAGHN